MSSECLRLSVGNTPNGDVEDFQRSKSQSQNPNIEARNSSYNLGSEYNRPLILCGEDNSTSATPLRSLKRSLRSRFRVFSARKPSHKNENSKLRFICPDGTRNTRSRHLRFDLKRYTKSIFQMLVNLHWFSQVSFVAMSFIGSWVIFGLLWWALQKTVESMWNINCLVGVDSIYSAMLFSIETQTTIGYGSHYISNSCRSGLFLLFVQLIIGLFLESLLVAIIITKFTHPKLRSTEIVFSDKLCVHEDDGNMIVSFRIADMLNGDLSMPEAHVRVYLVHTTFNKKYEDEEKRERCLAMEELDVGYNSGHDRILLLVPWVVEHTVTPQSPLYNKSRHEIDNGVFEVIVILEGSVEETGSITQCMKSYIAEDVLWGYTFDTMISKQGRKFSIDFDKLNCCSMTPRATATMYEGRTATLGSLAENNGGGSIDISMTDRKNSVRASYTE